MNITEQKQTHRHRKQTSGYQQQKEQGRDQVVKGDQALTTRYKINKTQGWNVQHTEYSQYFIITLNEI